ncbi:DsbA family oxidoreductase [Tianweitania sp. BSSL-BM11]|uniref:DsbA family oxidoreductase n=1 Tax=Tianweitania aestuarii TaxID=2814886 RepID=A0ABS5RTZ9_9HYPH|nr:DsbA family oxidoreductase [Tianweitania aestuarii]MBS9720528.1 DsbA family oxidoreductase [Tianweitania aestuarii]
MSLKLTIDVVSDVVCPWCYIGQKKLERALALIPDIQVTVQWLPYQLDPTIPRNGTDRHAYMLAKFGSAEKVDEIHARIASVGQELGITFDFAAIKIAANTLDAHRLIRWAGATSHDIQGRLISNLFSAFFEQGRDIGDRETLTDLASKSGMDAAVVSALLATQSDVEAVQQEVATATNMGITGVPCFLLDGRYALMGAQEPGVLADAIRQVAQYTAS